MHDETNRLWEARGQLQAVLAAMPAEARFEGVREEGRTLLRQMEAWDSVMVSRQSRAYDDVENFAQGFTANWLFLVNATESDVPRVNEPSRARRTVLAAQWTELRARSDAMRQTAIPALNRRLFDLGIGAIRTDGAERRFVP